MIRYYVGVAIAALLFATPVRAADMAVKAPPPATVPTAYDWTGLYIGAHAGGGWQNTSFADPGALSVLNNCCLFVGATNGPGVASGTSSGGFLGGVQAGWMYQIGRLVAGADFDFSGTGLNGGSSDTFNSGGVGEAFSIKTDWTATATATLGIAHDRWMIYGKAGAAFADESYNLGIAAAGFSFVSGGDRQIVSGWTTGIGVKWALTDSWFVNAEYDFLDFGTHAAHVSGGLSATPAGAFGMTSNAGSFEPLFNQTVSEIKVGLNYKYLPPGLGSGSDLFLSADRSPPQRNYDWTGLYVGGHVGGGWQSANIADPSAYSILSNCCLVLGDNNNPSAIAAGTSAGFLGGAQAGWMYQVGRLVTGIDVDFTGTKLDSSGTSVISPGGAGFFANDSYSLRTNWTATSTADIGIADGRWLVYTKAGVAFADDTFGVSINGAGSQFVAPIPFTFSGSSNQVVPGWTAGLGVKWALSSDWFVNAEYDLLDFGTQTAHVSGAFSATPASPPIGPGIPPVGPGATFNPMFSQTISEVKIGLNYKPSGNSGPLLTPENPKTDYTWSGFYIGGHAGGGWTDTAFADPGGYSTLNNCCVLLSHTNEPGAASDATGGGALGGVQAGWMYQLHRLVVGADIDFSGTELKGSGSVVYPALAGVGDFVNEGYSVRTDWTATTTTVLGFASGSWLAYAKAGAAWAENRYSLSIAGAGGNFGPGGAVPFAFASSASDLVYGWTAGAGVKWALSGNWFANAEYDFLDFGSKAENLPGTFTVAPQFAALTAATFHPTFNPTVSEVKVGLNYKFPPGFSFW
jgi:outer membrane immunogenic protein